MQPTKMEDLVNEHKALLKNRDLLMDIINGKGGKYKNEKSKVYNFWKNGVYDAEVMNALNSLDSDFTPFKLSDSSYNLFLYANRMGHKFVNAEHNTVDMFLKKEKYPVGESCIPRLPFLALECNLDLQMDDISLDAYYDESKDYCNKICDLIRKIVTNSKSSHKAIKNTSNIYAKAYNYVLYSLEYELEDIIYKLSSDLDKGKIDRKEYDALVPLVFTTCSMVEGSSFSKNPFLRHSHNLFLD